MSFIIQGVDLPKGYKALHMRVQSDGVVRYLIEGDDPVHIIDGARAIQIPKDHGRIVELKDIRYCALSSDGKSRELEFLLATQVEALPTILEAEG